MIGKMVGGMAKRSAAMFPKLHGLGASETHSTIEHGKTTGKLLLAHATRKFTCGGIEAFVR